MSRQEKYELALLQLDALLGESGNALSNLANTSALLSQVLVDQVFVGFYLFDGEKLVLGPFQGGVSCVNIALGQGVCGESASQKKTIIVDDVSKHQNYIACDAAARSEIVIPLVKAGKLIGVLDLDASKVNGYDEIDRAFLEESCQVLIDKTNWYFNQFSIEAKDEK